MSRPFETGRLERSVTLHCMGDPGFANFTRILGWLAGGLNARSGPHTRVAIWTGWGFVDNVREVGRGHVDVGVATPASFIPMALDGRGPYGGEAFPHLRALATMPQYDRLVFMVTEECGVRSFDDLHGKRLRLATAPNDGINHIGLAAARILELAGVEAEIVDEPWFREGLERVRAGAADGIIQEAIMTPGWQDICRERRMHWLDVPADVLSQVEAALSWRRAVVPAGYFPGLEHELTTLDFSDFLVFCREDLPEDLAYVLTRFMCEERAGLERHYRHLPPEHSPVGYPLEPAKMGLTTIPLHPGAARYYREIGS
ncbi:MAG TPA: TAXI family TRAP transporter solute-binding subunit [Chloroflexota bacterium]